MLYPSFFTVAVAAVLSLQHVAAIPLDVKMGDGSSDNKKAINEAMPLVNQKIKNMKAVIDLPDAQAKAHPAVVKSFGANANVGEIRKNVNTLATSKIMVPTTDAVSGVTQGATYPHNGHVVFGSSFYNSDKNTQAGTIIHEASHAKANTVDHFKTDGTPGHKTDPGVRVGYKDSHMAELNQKHSDQMHHNADAYRVFGDECPNVRRSLYRRAMEEPHPEIRSELLRRAAHACAWKPKGKAATAAGAKHAAGEHKAATGAKHLAKGTGSQKSLSAKKPLHAKGTAAKVHKVTSKKSPLSGGAKRLTQSKAASKKTAGHGASKVSGGKVAHAGAHATSKKVSGSKVAHNGAHAASKKAVSKGSHASAQRAQTKARPVQHAKVVQQKAASKPAPKRVNGKKH